jgi:hypothetical protein
MHIARERAILEEQERQAIHDLSAAYADADRAYALMQAGYNRLSAAQEQYDRAYNAFFNLGGKVSLELVLDARIRLAEAETSYHRGRIEYAIAVKNVHFEKGSLLDYNGAGLANEAFCQGCPDAVVHRIATSVEETPINYVLAAKQKERADAAALEKAADPSEPEAPWQGRNISYEEPVLMPPTERPQMPAASKLAPNEPVHLAAPRAPLPQHTNRTTLSPAPAAEGRSAAAEAAQAAREVAAPPASLSGSRLAPAAVTIAPLKPERLPAVEP